MSRYVISKAGWARGFLALAAVLLLIAGCLSLPVSVAFAQPPEAPPAQGPAPSPTPEPNPITQVINQIIQFPFENLTQALQNALQSILNNSVAPLESVFSASIARWLTSSPGIITPGGGLANGEDVMGPAWRLMVKIAVLLWPLTLAIIAAIAAKDAVAAASWGIGDLKETLGGWLLAVVASATSLYWMDLANRFTNATTTAILNMSFTGEAGFQPNALTTLVFGTAGVLLTFLAPPASLFIVVFVILLGFAVLTALIFQFLARFVVLYVLVALAPVVIILGVLPPMRWFSYTWLRGLVLVEAVGPINALLLKLVMVLTVRGASNDPVSAFVNFVGALGVLSILLTIDGVIIKSVFGAVQEVAAKALSTVTQVATLALAGVTALAGGSIAAGGVGAAAGTGGGGAPGAGGAAVTGTNGIAAAATSAGGPTQAARRAFNPAAALRGAGDVLYRQPGMLGSVGAAMRSVGGTLAQRQREDAVQARWQASHATRGSGTQPGNRGPANSGGGGGSGGGANPSAGTPMTGAGGPNPRGPGLPPGNVPPAPSRPPSSPGTSLPSSASAAPANNPTSGSTAIPASLQSSATSGGPNQAGSNSPSTLPGAGNRLTSADLNGNMNANGTRPSIAAIPPPLSPSATPISPEAGGIGAPISINGPRSSPDAALPPMQAPSVSPMGEPLSSPRTPAAPSLAPQAASALSILPAPLRERGATLAAQYAPQEQPAVVRAAVESLSALEFTGQFTNPTAIAAAWDRGMGPVLASAREGLPLATMAQDSGFGGNVAGYVTHRLTQSNPPQLEVPAQPTPWHPQLSPHDWETGTAIAQGLGNARMRPGDAARLYHEIRSPDSGAGWTAGMQFIEMVRETVQGRPSDPIAALSARLSEMESRGALSATAMALWRANLGRLP